MIIAGSNDEAVENPEVRVFKAKHCKAVPVEIGVYTGVPTDELLLSVKGS
jgi:hypothetical protein